MVSRGHSLRGWLGIAILFAVLTRPAEPQVCGNPGQDGAGNNLTGVVNTYYPGTAANLPAGSTSIPVGAPLGGPPIAAGNLLLIIQMQDADIFITGGAAPNDERYGDGSGTAGSTTGTGTGSTALNNTGLYEYVVATGPVSGGVVPIAGAGGGGGTLNTYRNDAATATTGQRRYQVVRVPQYTTVTLGAALTASPWNGSTGGVLAIDVRDSLNLNGQTVSVQGLGFRGGEGQNLPGGDSTGTALPTDYRQVADPAAGVDSHGNKGEGIAGTPRFMAGATNPEGEGYPTGSRARGAPGNAGGGGNSGDPASNSSTAGGGGGGNGGTGGNGGNTGANGSANINLPYGGNGGLAFFTPGTTTRAWGPARVVMGGGGGSGSKNSGGPTSTGGAGGGLILFRTGSVTGAGTLNADGNAGQDGGNNAGGGGGAGGSMILTTLSGTWAGATITARGGNGGNAGTGTTDIGPGGGGGGGVVILSGAATSVSTTTGVNGTTNSGAWGSTSGTDDAPAPGSGGNPFALPTDIPGAESGAECFTTGTPSANNDTYTIDPGQTLTVAAPGFLANDTDPDLDSLTATLVDLPNFASSFTFGMDGSFTYTPNPGFVGTDIFTYTVSDGTNTSNVASVTIIVGLLEFPAGYCGALGWEALLPLGALWILRRVRRPARR